jgi:hypothetical protein
MRALSARLARRPRGRTPATPSATVPRLVALTDVHTGAAHLVTDEAMAAGRRAGGRYAAVCGVDVLPASLTAPERRICHDCAALAVAK